MAATKNSGARLSGPPRPLPAEKAWEAIISAPEVARGYSQQQVEAEHLMKALLEQPNGLARRILSKAGLNPTQVGGGRASSTPTQHEA